MITEADKFHYKRIAQEEGLVITEAAHSIVCDLLDGMPASWYPKYLQAALYIIGAKVFSDCRERGWTVAVCTARAGAAMHAVKGAIYRFSPRDKTDEEVNE